AGLVPAESRAAILASVPDQRRLAAATALAAIGAFLLGAAVIAFIAANWGAIPRLVRFAMILAAFLATACGAAWGAGRDRQVLKNVLLSVSALIFAAAIGLTGQIFDIAGDPVAAFRGAGLAAVLLALAGRSPWAAAAGLFFLALGDRSQPFNQDGFGWLLLAAPLALPLALLWRSTALAHAAGLAMLLAPLSLPDELRITPEARFLLIAAAFAGLAAGARWLRGRFPGTASAVYDWFVFGALIYFGAAGVGAGSLGVGHSVAWLALAAATVALGRHDAHGPVTAAGVLSLFAAGAALLFDLGVGLLTAAAVFAGCALAALVVAVFLRRSRSA
ncbi:MAG: DUF2157 domain-containing protein, partial [Phenylobacterium sp.]